MSDITKPSLPPSFWITSYLELALAHARNLRVKKEEEAGNSYLSRIAFPNMNDFSAEYIKDPVITQRKTHSEVSLLLKERFPDKKGLSSRSVRRFCLENGIHLHKRLSNDELEQCTRDVVARVSISF